jgi:hypothetical protein
VEAIPVQLDGAQDKSEVSFLSIGAPRLTPGLSGSPLLFQGQLVGVLRQVTPDGRRGTAERIDWIAEAAREYFHADQ